MSDPDSPADNKSGADAEKPDTPVSTDDQPAVTAEKKSKIVTIALDAMGGDNAPSAIVQGAVQAVDCIDGIHITLVGDEDAITGELSSKARPDGSISVKHADQVVAMDESPSTAVRKKRRSSIHVGLQLVADGSADAFVSAGNTGAVMAASTLILRNIEGIDRAAIAVPLPTSKGVTVLLDAGANVVCKANHLYQFGVMGSIYSRYVMGAKLPRVGLLAIGEEDIKGNTVTREALEMMTRSSLNFVGNTEAKLLYKGAADVVVCDGFTGNIALKISESLAEMIGSFMKEMFRGTWRGKLSYLMLRPFLDDFSKRVDHSEVGGAPLLGIAGAVFISHGSSGPKSIKSAMAGAKKFVLEDVNGHIRDTLESNAGILATTAKKQSGLWDQMKRKIGLEPSEEPER